MLMQWVGIGKGIGKEGEKECMPLYSNVVNDTTKLPDHYKQ